MKYFSILFILLLTSSCQKIIKQSQPIGTWCKCFKDGEYREYKITDKYMMMLIEDYDGVFLYNNKFENNSLFWSSMYPEKYSSIQDIDTLIIINQSKKKLNLKSKYWKTHLILDKIINEIKEVDSLNLEKWKKETISKFLIRSENRNCPDLRTEEEKILYDLGNGNPEEVEEEVEIPLDYIKDSIN